MGTLALQGGFGVTLKQLLSSFALPRFAILLVVTLLLCSCASTSDDVARLDRSSDLASADLSSDDTSSDADSYWGEIDEEGDFGDDDDAYWGDIEEEDDGDPLETLNRFIFAFNETLDVFLLRPAAETYRFLIPEVMRDSVQNFLRNLRSPVILANNVFQGNEPGVDNTVIRFAINSTIGVLGLFDVATGMGYPYEDDDFGLTLASYNMESGPYLVLPLFGPSSFRDGFGRGVDVFLDPLTYVLTREQSAGRLIVSGIDTRSRFIDQIDDLKRDSVDFYSRIRSLYQQNRQKAVDERIEFRIENGAVLPDHGRQSLAAKEVQ